MTYTPDWVRNALNEKIGSCDYRDDGYDVTYIVEREVCDDIEMWQGTIDSSYFQTLEELSWRELYVEQL